MGLQNRDGLRDTVVAGFARIELAFRWWAEFSRIRLRAVKVAVCLFFPVLWTVTAQFPRQSRSHRGRVESGCVATSSGR